MGITQHCHYRSPTYLTEPMGSNLGTKPVLLQFATENLEVLGHYTCPALLGAITTIAWSARGNFFMLESIAKSTAMAVTRICQQRHCIDLLRESRLFTLVEACKANGLGYLFDLTATHWVISPTLQSQATIGSRFTECPLQEARRFILVLT